MPHDHKLYFNGVSGTTGRYSLRPRSLGAFSKSVRGRQPSPVTAPRAVEAGIDPRDLSSAGWGVVFPEGTDPDLYDALQPLLDLRKAQATRQDERLFRQLTCLPGETRRRFLPRYGAAPGPVDPHRVPYYLLLVGGPETVPFHFQYGLAPQYAVGRLAFATIEEYARYARSVVDYERGEAHCRRSAAVFGVRNEDDPATEISVEYLARPLAAKLAASRPGWRLGTVLGSTATRARLSRLLKAPERPSLLFTAGHAVLFPRDHPRQLGEQGALLCYDWPGPKEWRGRIPEEHLFAAHDVPDEAQIHGLMSFHFACCSAGTPRFDSLDYSAGPGALEERQPIATDPFIARLPQRLLSHPRGGALAVVGHVDRAFEQSFLWDDTGSQVGVFASALEKIMDGEPVGFAMEVFSQRYAEISTELLALDLESRDTGEAPDEVEQARLWTAFHDARNYVVLGDPAVRLRTEEPHICPPPGDRR